MQRVDQRQRIGEARGLDDHALEGRDLAAQPAVVQPFQAVMQRAVGRAAQAPGVEHDDVLVRALEQHVVQRHRAEFVHDHGRVGEFALAHQAREQRRLAAAQESGQQMDGQRRAGAHGHRGGCEGQARQAVAGAAAAAGWGRPRR